MIDGNEWLQMGSNSTAAPPSPSSRNDAEEELEEYLRMKKLANGGPPSSPSRKGPPASPGRVRILRPGAFTLRDVKDRLKRELDGY